MNNCKGRELEGGSKIYGEKIKMILERRSEESKIRHKNVGKEEN
jgi:hypothetical protein